VQNLSWKYNNINIRAIRLAEKGLTGYHSKHYSINLKGRDT
jgi:hypothetical protein